MNVICNVRECGYNVGGLCVYGTFLKIKNGTCSWLIDNPNFRGRAQEPPSEEVRDERPDE